MTGRERLNAVLKKQPTDQLPWTTLVDNTTLDHFPEELRGNGGIDFYRHLGCDILLLNGWNTPHRLRSPGLRWGDNVTIEHRKDGIRDITTWQTPWGSLTSIGQQGHPTKYPIDSIEALCIYRKMWEEACFEAHDDSEEFAALDTLIGADGVITRFWGPSTVPQLLEQDMGTENFYYLQADHPDEMDVLIRTIHEQQLQAFEHLADGPWDSVTLVENTSTFYISPQVYERYNMPHQRDFVERVKQRGKTAILHMCGHVHALLDLIRETGCDGIHALTPPPTGNTAWEKALDVLGDDLIIMGALDPTIFASDPVGGIGPALDRLITPRLREANFVLAPFADGIPVDIERFYAVKHWMDDNARL